MAKKKRKPIKPKNTAKLRRPKVTVQKRYDGLPKITGYYTDIAPKLKRVIDKIFKDYDFATSYIGATENLDSRWSNYSDWEFKHVLYETSSKSNAELVETKLIAYTKNKELSCNKDDKSKGLRKGAVIYYVYILAGKKCKKRD